MDFYTPPRTSLLDSIRRTIEEKNLFSARSRLNYVSAFNRAKNTNGSRNRFSSPLGGRGAAIETRLFRLRSKVIQEIIQSEEVYVNQLKIIRDEFMDDMEIQIAFSRRDYCAIFGNIPVLLEVNERLMEGLKNCSVNSSNDENPLTPATPKTVAESFLHYAPFLKLYSTYASGFQQGQNILMSATGQNSQIRALIKAKEEKLNNTLQSYLITPIQRIPRYKLLLQQLVGYMGNSRSDPDLQSLIDSIKKLDQVAHHMNEMIRQHENSCKLVELNTWLGKNYHGNLVEPGRYFIKSSTVTKANATSVLAQNNQMYVILLSDQILSCKIKSDLGTKGCLQPTLVLPLKKCDATVVRDQYVEIACEEESLKFTLHDPDEIHEWALVINESARALKRRSATLKKPSSNARPLKKEQIKDAIKNRKRGVKRAAIEESPAPSPGKLRRFFNISGRLDEIVDYLSPKKWTSPTKASEKVPPKHVTFKSPPDFKNVTPNGMQRIHTLESEMYVPLPMSRYSRNSCNIL